MNKTLLVIAASCMLTAFSSCQKQQNDAPVAGSNDSATTMAIAYVNTDSLLMNYEYAKLKNDELMSKEESSRAEFNQKSRVFQQDVAEFQRKVQNNGFLSVDRAQKEQDRLAKVEQELQELNDKLSAELMQENARANQELRDTIVNFLNEYAKDKYQLILSNSSLNNNVLYSAAGIDITNEVVASLNARYNSSKK